VKYPGPKFEFVHAYKYLETCAQKNWTLSPVESASPDKPASTVAVVATRDNSGVDDTDGVPADEELGGAARVSGSRSASAGAVVVDGDAGDSASVAVAIETCLSKATA
jgi:hypothetical protein